MQTLVAYTYTHNKYQLNIKDLILVESCYMLYIV